MAGNASTHAVSVWRQGSGIAVKSGLTTFVRTSLTCDGVELMVERSAVVRERVRE